MAELVRVGPHTSMLRFFRKLGAPVDRELASAGLSTELEHFSQDYVPWARICGVRRKLERAEGISDLGLEAWPMQKPDDVRPDIIAPVMRGMPLGQRVERMFLATPRSHPQVHT